MSLEEALILVVDDNEMNRDMLSRRLRRQKYNSIVAENGEQALQLVHEHAFDLILLDIMMPSISGYEVLERLKADTSTAHIPVIMISAVDDLESVVRCIELGAEDYLFKPFNPVLLKARVNASIRKNRLSPTTIRPIHEAIQTANTALTEADLPSEHATHVTSIQTELDKLTALLDGA